MVCFADIYGAITCNDIDYFRDNLSDIIDHTEERYVSECRPINRDFPLLSAVRKGRDIIAEMLIKEKPEWICYAGDIDSDYNPFLASILEENYHIYRTMANWIVLNDPSKFSKIYRISESFIGSPLSLAIRFNYCDKIAISLIEYGAISSQANTDYLQMCKDYRKNLVAEKIREKEALLAIMNGNERKVSV